MLEYKVKFEVFEGPLDLLLYLIKKEEVDIYEINLTKIATEFIEYIEMMRQLDLVVAGDFLVMASTLMFIKSRELLPEEEQAATEEDEEEENPKWELIRQLVEYKKFKDAAGRLQELEEQRENTFPRLPGKIEWEPDPPPGGPQVSLFTLINAVNRILERFHDQGETREIFEDRWSVSQKIEDLSGMIHERRRLRFSALFDNATTRSEVVATFLALLELIRLRRLIAYQPSLFEEIEIEASEETGQEEASPESPESEEGSEPAEEAIESPEDSLTEV